MVREKEKKIKGVLMLGKELEEGFNNFFSPGQKKFKAQNLRFKVLKAIESSTTDMTYMNDLRSKIYLFYGDLFRLIGSILLMLGGL